LKKIKNANTQEEAKHYIDELKTELQKEKKWKKFWYCWHYFCRWL
jgi:ssDNA-binding Zn-finger/Zn-ribbon topoisomerase 1